MRSVTHRSAHAQADKKSKWFRPQKYDWQRSAQNGCALGVLDVNPVVTGLERKIGARAISVREGTAESRATIRVATLKEGIGSSHSEWVGPPIAVFAFVRTRVRLLRRRLLHHTAAHPAATTLLRSTTAGRRLFLGRLFLGADAHVLIGPDHPLGKQPRQTLVNDQAGHDQPSSCAAIAKHQFNYNLRLDEC